MTAAPEAAFDDLELAAANRLAPELTERSPEIEQARQMPADLVRRMQQAGLTAGSCVSPPVKRRSGAAPSSGRNSSALPGRRSCS